MGWGGVPTGAGLVDGGVDQGPWLQERVGGGDGSSKEGGGLGFGRLFKEEQVQGRGQGRVGLAVGGGCKGFGWGGGVGGRGTGPRDGANFATCVVFLLFLTRTKRRKMAFLKDALWGGGGTHRSWPGGRGGRPRALIPGKGSGKGWERLGGLAWWTGEAGGGARASVPGG